ncbi:MAG: carboxypeptidase regulatory-like domain-containing protein, partial [Acidimicrobiales bacterium]|nr:carboxypeptidase regulatory-like domain-containing protein [Acidimicrobiales bacterium]
TTTTNTTIVDQSLAAANTVSGTITDSVTGDPIPGAEARLRNAADNTFVATAKANGAGVYTFTNLAPGTYKIAFRDPTGAHTQIFNGSAPGFPTAPPIPIAPGDT